MRRSFAIFVSTLMVAVLVTAALGVSATAGKKDHTEGCTPGYWKQSQHFGNWTAPYVPETPFSDVFEDAFPGMTLLEVLGQGGGGLNALGRHTVAALLNAASPDVEFGSTTDDVKDLFDGVYPGTKSEYNALKATFEAANELGCPLGRAEQQNG